MKSKSFALRFAAVPYYVWSAIFIIVPLLMVGYYTFADANGSLTFDNILSLGKYGKTFAISMWYAFIATVISLLIAYPLSYFMTKTKPSTQRLLMLLIMLPMWTNFLIRTYSWITILSNKGILNTIFTFIGLPEVRMVDTPGAVIMGMIYNFLPYMVLPIYTSMSKIENSLLEAASDLGANSISRIRRVILPLSLPGVISGITMVFVPCVSTFYISQKLGGGKLLLIGDVIEMKFMSSYNYNIGASLSLVLMIIILLSLAVMNRFSDDDEGGIVV